MVMQNPTLCTELVQRALPELEVGPLHLVNPQQDVHSALLARALRPRRSGADLCLRDAGQR